MAEEPEPGESIGGYEVLHKVARGGMATVLAVREPATKKVYALKLLLPLGHAEESRSRFRREFRAMSRLNHPNVLRVYEWGLHGDRPWFTMELLDGHDLRAEIETLKDHPAERRFERIQEIIRQVARALAYIHERGMVHRDVTPGNIFIHTDGSVRLMDFGVVKDMGAELTAVGEVIGTVAYMAPEQISGASLDARADLYSLGAVLYLMLTGRRVFSAHTIHGFMEKHLKEAPKPPRSLTPEVPQHLEDIALRLLHKKPEDRFASASHLLHVLGDVSDEAGDRWPPRTVGRTLLKARLRDAIDEVAAGRHGSVQLLTAPNGYGKTRLLDLSEGWARRQGLPVARGRCRVDDRPFGAFVGIYRDLRTGEPNELLEQAFGPDTNTFLERYPVISTFRDLVVDRAPLVVILDDLHLADSATVEMLTYLVRNTLELAGEPVLFVLGHDDVEGTIRRQLGGMDPVDVLPVGPLSAAEVEEMVVSVLDSAPASMALAERLHKESSGSPAFIADMLRGLMDDGLIIAEQTGRWKLTIDASEITRSRLPMPASLRHALRDRLAAVSPEANQLGKLLALSRRRVDVEVLLAVTTLDEDDAMDALDDLLDAGIVEEHRSEDTEFYELCHGRFREVLLDMWDPPKLSEGHRTFGEALEEQNRRGLGAVGEELAHHFEAAGLHSKAYTYLLRTAGRHLSRSLYEECLAFLDRALTMEPMARRWIALDSADRKLAELHLGESQARLHLGQLPEALRAVERADELSKLVGDPRLQSRVATEHGIQLRQQGRVADAQPHLQTAIKRAEEAGDQSLLPSPLYQLGGLLWGQGDLESAEAHWRRTLEIGLQIGDERAQGNGYNGLAILDICRGQSMQARRHLEQASRTFERLGMLGPLVIVRVNLIETYLITGVLRKALALADRTHSQAEEVGLKQGVMLGRAWRAKVLATIGRLDEALNNATEALRLAEQIEAREDEPLIRLTLIEVLSGLGRPAEALSHAEALKATLSIHDHEGIMQEAGAQTARLLADLDRPEEASALLAATTESRAWPHLRVRSELALAHAYRALERTEDARTLYSRALAGSEANGYRLFQLEAHQALQHVAADEAGQARHRRIAEGLARSLAANLPPDDAARFLARGA